MRLRQVLLRLVIKSCQCRWVSSDAKKYARIVKMAQRLSDISHCCCGQDCDNCVRIDATESVLKLCADMDTETCLRLLDENVEDNMATRYLTMCLRMRKNKNASH